MYVPILNNYVCSIPSSYNMYTLLPQYISLKYDDYICIILYRNFAWLLT